VPSPKKPVPPKALARPIVATGLAATVLIAAGAFVLSFAALTDLAVMAGISPALGWIWPLIVDGLIVAATVAILALAGQGARVLAYPWALLIVGATVSTAANAVHAILSVQHGQGAVPPVVSALVAAMPPLVLLAITHLSVVLVQRAPAAPKAAKPARAGSQSKTPGAATPTRSPRPRLETVPDTYEELVSQAP
jgi:hypothetical protein